MRERLPPLAAAAIACAAALAAGEPDAGSIYCWKNASGKTECGDRAPSDAAVRELTRQGVLKSTREAPLTPEQQKAREEKDARDKEDKAQREQQARKDRALMETFTTEGEIEAKRKREIATLEAQIANLQTTLRNVDERQTDANRRAEEYRKSSGKVPQVIQDELARIDREKISLNSQLGKRRAEAAEVNAHYAQLRKRFVELKGGLPPGAPSPAPADAAAAPAAANAPGATAPPPSAAPAATPAPSGTARK